jgi:hypothetical protein
MILWLNPPRSRSTGEAERIIVCNNDDVNAVGFARFPWNHDVGLKT